MAAADTNSMALVCIDGENYTLKQIPSKESALVIASRKDLLGAVDLSKLVSDLGLVGKCVRIAYNGVAGVTDLQIRIQDVGYEITKLCDKSAVTVAKFSTSSRQVLVELKTCYGYLLNGMEVVAVGSYLTLGEIASKMAKAAQELHDDFEKAGERVKTTLKETMKTKGLQEQEKKKLESELKEFELAKQKADAAKRQADEAMVKAEKFYSEARSREEKISEEEMSVKRDLVKGFTKLASSATSMISLGAVTKLAKSAVAAVAGATAGSSTDAEQKVEEEEIKARASTTQEALKAAAEEKLIHLEEMHKQQDRRLEAMQMFSVMASKIEGCKSDQEITEATITSLHSAIGGLKELADIMLQAALFWMQVKAHCDSMSNGPLKNILQTAMTIKDEEKRRELWTSDVFKEQAVREYSMWVALEDVCTSYMDCIRDTQHELHKYIRENPTIKESRDNIRQLAIDLQVDIRKAQRAIEEERESTRLMQIEAAKDV